MVHIIAQPSRPHNTTYYKTLDYTFGLVLNFNRLVHVLWITLKSGYTHAHNNTMESMTLSKLCAMHTVSGSECLAQAVVRWGLNRGLGTSLYHSEPQCKLCANCSPPLSTTSRTAGVVEVL